MKANALKMLPLLTSLTLPSHSAEIREAQAKIAPFPAEQTTDSLGLPPGRTEISIGKRELAFNWTSPHISVYTNDSTYVVAVQMRSYVAPDRSCIAFFNGTNLMRSFTARDVFHQLGQGFPFPASSPIFYAHGLAVRNEKFLYAVESDAEELITFDLKSGRLVAVESKFAGLQFTSWYKGFSERAARFSCSRRLVGRIFATEGNNAVYVNGGYDYDGHNFIRRLRVFLGKNVSAEPNRGQVWALGLIEDKGDLVASYAEQVEFDF